MHSCSKKIGKKNKSKITVAENQIGIETVSEQLPQLGLGFGFELGFESVLGLGTIFLRENCPKERHFVLIS